MRYFRAEGIIIKRKNYGEADRLITIFTRQFGKLQVKATGVRKITSRRSPHVELLNYTEVALYQGKHYPILVEAVTKNLFSDIKNDLTKVGFSYHLCELIDGLCPENEEHESVFQLLKSTLDRLSVASNKVILSPSTKLRVNLAKDLIDETKILGHSPQKDTFSLIHEFEVELLTLLGYWKGNTALSNTLDTRDFIENIIERRLKSRKIFAKLD